MAWELQILDFLQGIRTPSGDALIPFITALGDKGAVWIILTVILLLIPKKRRTGAVMTASLCLDLLLCNVLLKNIVARTRPFDVNTAIALLISKPADFSFPSGHTAASFAAASALYFAGEKRLWKPALVLAVLIAFSRMYLYVHYPTDILGGMIVGIVSGYLGSRLVGAVQKKINP
ncbi:MAG: phosphatase PAP2 family protein [Clostridiales bacterium]|nr:phosphatase PAP2 family protein [Clostridiales bacterium]